MSVSTVVLQGNTCRQGTHTDVAGINEPGKTSLPAAVERGRDPAQTMADEQFTCVLRRELHKAPLVLCAWGHRM